MPTQRIIHTDNLEYLRTLKTKSVDIAIIDPQTGQGEGRNHARKNYKVKQKNGAIHLLDRPHHISDWDDEQPPQEFFDELFRVSKHQIIMCENYLSFNQKDKSNGRIVWNLLRKVNFSDCNIMWQSLTNKIHYFEYLWNGMIQGTAINSTRQIGNKKLNQKRIHPTEKPIIVYRHLLREFCQPGWTVLDTHAGSAACGISCAIEGFDYIGLEKDITFYSKAYKRLQDHHNAPTLKLK